MTTLPAFKQHLVDSPELQSLILHNVTRTGKVLGSGSYGNVEEVAIPGALCAAKKIHDFLSKVDPKWLAKETAEENIRKFVEECKLMNRLRHPNIVQFIGIWVSDLESSLPALVMEKMLMSLHDLLEPDGAKVMAPKLHIPLGLKCSILQDIAQGIAFLHKQFPPVVHRDLSARNVLLNSAMVAKIADMGMARILPDKVNVTMTKAPGAHVYMPPEALGNKSQYDTSIDLFSLGVIAIFVLIQEFPHNLKPPTYTDKKGRFCGRTELQRREVYMEKIYSMFSMTDAMVQLITKCLQNDPKRRPSVDDALKTIGQAVKQVKDYDILHFSKLELLQVVEKKEKDCDVLREEVKKFRDQVAQLNQENARLQQELTQATEDKKRQKNEDYEDQEKLPMTPPVLPTRQSSLELKPHARIETWYKEVDRDYAAKLLNDCVNGTFLCRPTTKETKVSSGGFHTHTIDCVYNGIKRYRVIKHNDKYGLTPPCTFESLMDLVLYFSVHYVPSNDNNNVLLKFPLFL